MYIDFIICKESQAERNNLYMAPAWSYIEKGEYILNDRNQSAEVIAVATMSAKMLPFMKIVFNIEPDEPIRRIKGTFNDMHYGRFDEEFEEWAKEKESE